MAEGRKPYLLDIISTLNEHGVAYIICGGMAAVYHGVERMTMDLDISLERSPENLRKFLQAIQTLNMVPRAPVKSEVLLDRETMDRFVTEKNALVFTFWDVDSPYRQIDVFLREDHDFHTLIDSAVTARVEGKPVKVLSGETLLQLKKAIPHPRDKDRLDIIALERILGKRP